METYLLAASTLVQLAAAVVAGVIAWTTLRHAWILVGFAILLMATRRGITLYQALLLDKSIDPVAESVALLISLLMLGGFIGLLRRERAITGFPQDAAAAKASAPVAIAALIGILIVIGSTIVAYYSFMATRSALIEGILSANLRTAQSFSTVADTPNLPLTSSDRIGLIEDFWANIPARYEGSYLCVVDSDGKLLVNTKNRSIEGQYVGDSPIRDEEQRYSNLDDLLHAGENWVGWYVSANGEEQIAAFSYSSALSSLVAVHVPAKSVEREILLKMLPLAIGLVFILLLLLPAALGVLYRAYAETLRAVQSSERQYRAVVEDQTELIRRVLPDGTFSFANEAYREYFGLRSDELIGREFDAQIPVEERADIDVHIASLNRQNPVDTIEHRVIRADGEVCWQRWTDRVICGERGEVVEIQGTGRDITHEIELNDQLRQAQKMEAIGILAGGIAHDFNNALTVISGNAELSLDSVPVSSRKQIEHILEASDRASRLVQQILTFSRKESVHLKPLNLADIIQESLEMIRSVIPANIEIRKNIIGDCPNILGDKTQIHQIIVNLCTNASHAMEKTGGLLQLSLKRAGESLVLRIKDNGSGISQEDQQNIFDPFFTTKEVGKGTGLGLSVVCRIIENHQAEISVESALDEGTTFTVTFPITTEAIVEEPKHERCMVGTGRILIVEDEPAIAELYQIILESTGYEVTTRENGLAALTLFKEQPNQFDLVLTDQTMPKMTGEELAKQLFTIRPDLPIVLISGYSEMANSEQPLDSGIRQYLQKPVKLRLLTEAVANCLKEDRSQNNRLN